MVFGWLQPFGILETGSTPHGAGLILLEVIAAALNTASQVEVAHVTINLEIACCAFAPFGRASLLNEWVFTRSFTLQGSARFYMRESIQICNQSPPLHLAQGYLRVH